MKKYNINDFVFNEEDGLAEVRLRVNDPEQLLRLLVAAIKSGKLEADIALKSVKREANYLPPLLQGRFLFPARNPI